MEFENIWNWFCKLCLIALSLICLNSLIGDLYFRVKFSFPKGQKVENTFINTFDEPVQYNLTKNRYIKAYGEKNIYALKLQAKYSISGLVVAKNTNFWFRDIMRRDFDDICLMDIGLVWGSLANDPKTLYKHWKFKSSKKLGQSRSLDFRTIPPYEGMPWDINYVKTHVSHTHLIAANPNIMAALLTIKKNDIIKLDGYLVDIYTEKSKLIAQTSMSRSDTNATSRGSGACENMYVEQVQIGNKIYK